MRDAENNTYIALVFFAGRAVALFLIWTSFETGLEFSWITPAALGLETITILLNFQKYSAGATLVLTTIVDSVFLLFLFAGGEKVFLAMLLAQSFTAGYAKLNSISAIANDLLTDGGLRHNKYFLGVIIVASLLTGRFVPAGITWFGLLSLFLYKLGSTYSNQQIQTVYFRVWVVTGSLVGLGIGYVAWNIGNITMLFTTTLWGAWFLLQSINFSSIELDDVNSPTFGEGFLSIVIYCFFYLFTVDMGNIPLYLGLSFSIIAEVVSIIVISRLSKSINASERAPQTYVLSRLYKRLQR